jgi:hypothetical protein
MPSRGGKKLVVGSPGQILGIILGAARFPYAPSIDSPKLARAFSRSKTVMASYLKEVCSEIFDYFNAKLLPDQLCLKIDAILRERSLATDLIVYYVGHGGFLSNQEYFLACHETRDDNKRITGLRVADLGDTIHEAFRNRRVYFVLDCCYAGSAAGSLQAPVIELVNQQAERLPVGIAVLAASPRDKAAVTPEGASRTMFSDGLIQVLRAGVREGEQLLSLRDIGTAVVDLISRKYRDAGVRPEVSTPRQRDGDPADYRLFPNPSFAASSISKGQAFLTPAQLASIYRFPSELDGTGQCIGIIHLGEMPRMTDFKTYCAEELGIAPPKVTVVPILGARTKPSGTTSWGAADHLMMSMQICCGVAPAARQVVYVAPNTDSGFAGTIETAIADAKNDPSVLLIAWGGPESAFTAEVMARMNEAFMRASHRGITICCASGDAGATDGAPDGQLRVDFPASSPHCLACGGTSLAFEGDLMVDEIAWENGGGGFSTAFPAPDWQIEVFGEQTLASKEIAGRCVPDVSAHAAPGRGYRAYLRGEWTSLGGTTLSAALWAGLIALITQGTGQRIAFTPALFYRHFGRAGVCRDITKGSNGKDQAAYTAGPGWDPCTGWGSPNGTALLLAAKLYLSLSAGSAKPSVHLEFGHLYATSNSAR